jgi:hypothetical protein
VARGWLGYCFVLFYEGHLHFALCIIILIGPPFRWLYDRMSDWKQPRA